MYDLYFESAISVNSVSPVFASPKPYAKSFATSPLVTAPISTESTPEPTEEPTPAPTVTPGEEVDLQGLGYAYIFGYEPAIQRVDVTDEEGNVVGGKWVAEVKMAPEDAVTREQVAAMITRMVDQKYGTTDIVYPEQITLQSMRVHGM